MKILHVVPTYLPAYRYGGPIQSVHSLNKWLTRAGAEGTVFTTAIDGPVDLDVAFNMPVDRDGVRVTYFRPGRPRAWFYSPDLRRALRERAREFDIVHITSVFLAASSLGARAAQAADKPYLISPRGSLMRAPLEKRSALKKSLYLKLVERRNLERADAIHFTTEAEQAEYAALGYRLRRGVVVPNGLDPETLPEGDAQAFRAKHNIGPEHKVVLFLGRLSWKKGLDTLIPAFASVAREVPEAVLVIAGGDDENYSGTLNKLIDDAGVRDKVRLVGPSSRKDTSAAYQAADLFAFASYSENFAITAVEAMHFGLPVVLSEGIGVSPRVAAAQAGVVLPKDAAAFAREITALLKDPARAKQLGARGKALVTAEYSCEKMAAQFLAAYNEIVEAHRAP